MIFNARFSFPSIGEKLQDWPQSLFSATQKLRHIGVQMHAIVYGQANLPEILAMQKDFRYVFAFNDVKAMSQAADVIKNSLCNQGKCTR